MSHILIVEDETIIRSALRRLLERSGYSVDEAGSVPEAIEHNLADVDLVISDMRLPGAPGTELIARAAPVPVVMMTSYGSIKSAVEAVRAGAVDYITKPFDHDEMLLTVERALRERRLQQKNSQLRKELDSVRSASAMIGCCESMNQLFQRIAKVAPTGSTVLIYGESGTGKELVARALHDSSPRTDGPMISVNCAAIPETLIESELFGHEKGAFTGATAPRKGLVEAADGGTLFLDEIGELPLEAQARLLRLLQEKEIRRVGAVQSRKVDVRLVAATHRNLKQLAQQGNFREDLYYRLNVVELRLPPLRERGEDIIELAQALLLRAAGRIACGSLSMTPDTLSLIRHYHWPGNVRELENAMERAAILCDDGFITPELLGIELEIRPPTVVVPISTGAGARTFNEPVEDLSLEDYFAHFVLEHQDSMTETELAQKLGISRKSLWERRQRLGIPRKKG